MRNLRQAESSSRLAEAYVAPAMCHLDTSDEAAAICQLVGADVKQNPEGSRSAFHIIEALTGCLRCASSERRGRVTPQLHGTDEQLDVGGAA